MSLPAYAVMFRGKPACPCQVEWIPAYEREARRRGILGPDQQVTIYQLIGDYSKSGNTHSDGGAGDYLDLPGEDDLWLMRQMGADASWLRPSNWDHRGGIKHTHSVLTGCPHLAQEAVDQIAAVRANGDGLIGPGADTGPRPLSGRTWREGIKWAKEQEMADENRMREIAREEIENYRVDVGGKSKVKLVAAIQRLFERTQR